jgi:nicotinate-nucleotide pyrophosphorylase (carboxylating)
MCLYDRILIKDNHIDVAGSITNAVHKVREKWQSKFIIEVECRTLAEVKEALASQIDIIMLDNMEPELMRECLSLPRANKGIKFEASGNMEPEKIRRTSALGVDYISVGALTHSVQAFDFSLKIDLR